MRKIGLEDVLKDQGYIIFPIQGISMLPLLKEKEDTVKIVKLENEAKINDVVLYHGINNYVLHRIIGVKKKEYLIIGDNNNNLEHINKKDVIGVMVGYFKKKRYVSIEDEEYLNYVKNHIEGLDYRTRVRVYPEIPNEWKYVFGIIREVIGESDSHEVYEDMNWKAILSLCKMHSISAIVSTKLDKDICPVDIYNEFSAISAATLRKTIMFNAERARIIKIFEDQNIDYVYLKGIKTNTYYPRMGIREFADNDILVHNSDSKKIYKLMTNDEYEAAYLHGVHDSYHKNPFYNFEFHRRLFDEKKAFNGFFNNIWSKTIKVSDYEYCLSEEDFYIYNLGHFYKHYTKGGAGIRHFIDMYIIRKRMLTLDNINYDYINESIKKAKLENFEKEILDLVDKMFVHFDKMNYKDIIYIINSGTYGMLANDVNNTLDKHQGSKIKYVLSRIFVPYRSMKCMFPILRYIPILLPFCWVIRLFKPLFSKASREHFKGEIDVMKEYKKK